MSQQSKRGATRTSSTAPNTRGQSRRGVLRSRSAALSKLDLDSAFFWLLLVFLITVFAFLSLRERHVELDPRQVAEYELRTQMLANSTVYIVEVGKTEGLLSRLSPSDWARISTEIDYVSFIYDDPLSLTDEWVSSAESVLRNGSKVSERIGAGVGIALFPCGCLIPNAYFKRVTQRLEGFECVLLPGWVLAHEDVHWLRVGDKGNEDCKKREGMLAAKIAGKFRKELVEIHASLEAVKWEIEASDGKVEQDAGGGVSALVKGALEQVRKPVSGA